MPSSSFPAGRRLLGTSLVLALSAHLALAPGRAAAVEEIDPRPARPVAVVEAPPAIAPDLQLALSAGLQRARWYSGAPGLSMSVVAQDGRQWSGSDGVHPTGATLTADDTLPIGSATKTFTAALIEALAEEGRVALDAPTSDYLPGVWQAQGTTVRQLLTHTSGLADLYEPGKAALAFAPDMPLDLNAVLGPVGRYILPGTGFAYSNTNYYLLGMIIEAVTGRPVAEELQARFLDPLGLSRTRLASGADAQLPAAWNSLFWTSGAMVATPTDLARWGQALYTGEVLPAERVQSMLDFSDGDYYGEGTQLLSVGDRWVPGHSGLLYNTTTLMIHLPEEAVTIAVSATAPSTDLTLALTAAYDGGPSLLSLIQALAG